MRGASSQIELDPLQAMEAMAPVASRLRPRLPVLDNLKTHIVLTAVGPAGRTTLPRLSQIISDVRPPLLPLPPPAAPRAPHLSPLFPKSTPNPPILCSAGRSARSRE